ncbi:hypothetical protein EW026_g7879 [Hermanssonia centrifuga]|uniref:Uncharacterized protein n=1 Tax=Hermanssonia centrifuga TaxID=98765 RepID=A0A4S4K6A8_9APHY|nr:hypothetical protein EW026_g7879 [Hermanssonia centrifuga]
MTGPAIPRSELLGAQHSRPIRSNPHSSGVDITNDKQQQLVLIAVREKLRTDRMKQLGIAARQAKRDLRPEPRMKSSPAAAPRRIRSCAAVQRPPGDGHSEDAIHDIDDDELIEYDDDAAMVGVTMAGQASGSGAQPIGVIGAVGSSAAVTVQVVVKKSDKAAGKAVGKAVGKALGA